VGAGVGQAEDRAGVLEQCADFGLVVVGDDDPESCLEIFFEGEVDQEVEAVDPAFASVLLVARLQLALIRRAVHDNLAAEFGA